LVHDMSVQGLSKDSSDGGDDNGFVAQAQNAIGKGEKVLVETSRTRACVFTSCSMTTGCDMKVNLHP
jgi:hypothetical protein